MDSESFLTRRSIRKYQSTKIPNTLVQLLLEAAMSAPSAGNAQPWHFIVITENHLLKKIQAFHPYSQMLSHAPLAILICADRDKEKHPGFWVQDCSAAAMNLLMSAHILGLGAVWLGIHPVEKLIEGIHELFRLPSHVSPLALIAVGYPDEEKKPAYRFNSERVHYDQW